MADVGNIMTRLQGLKNVGKRRVMEPPEVLQDLDESDVDVSGTAQPQPLPDFGNFLPNTPQTEMGGELTAQSYDVRANTATPPPEEEEEGWGSSLRKLGSNLANYMKEGWTPGISDETRQRMGIKPLAQTPPIATQQVDEAEGLPPVTASQEVQQQEESPGLFGTIGKGIKDYLKPFGTEGHWYGEPTPENAQLMENAQLRAQGHNPDEYRAQQAEAKQKQQEEVKARAEKALENPTSTVVYGASDMVANQPELKAQFNKITGMDFTDEIAKQTSEYEKVLDDMDNVNNQEMQGYTDQEKRILQRIQNNEATDADKYFIGLAVLMPLIVGAFFGKQAALGALGGGAKGFADILGRRGKENMENEKLLADIQQNKGQNELKRAEIDLKRLGLPAEIRKNLPKDENEHLIGKNEVTWTDPASGEEMRGVQIKPGLVALPEFVKDKEELKEMRKEAQEINSAINPTKEINKLTGDIINIVDMMPEKGFFGQAFAAAISGKDPGLATKFVGEPIEYEGRKVNSYVVLEHKLKLLVDAYRQAKGMRALTNTVQEHIDSLFRNPSASFQSYQDTKDQMLYTRDLAQSRLMNTVTSAGFAPEFVAEMLQPHVKGVYDKLNAREGEKEAADLLRD